LSDFHDRQKSGIALSRPYASVAYAKTLKLCQYAGSGRVFEQYFKEAKKIPQHFCGLQRFLIRSVVVMRIRL